MADAEHEQLPRAYRIGLALRALGADDDLIAECLGIDKAGVANLITLGTRKLEHIEQGSHPLDPADGPQNSVPGTEGTADQRI